MEMEEIAKKLQGNCESFSISLVKTKSTMVKFADSRVTVTQKWNVTNISLLLVKKNKFLTSTFSSEKELEESLPSLHERLRLLEPTEIVPSVSENDRTLRAESLDQRISDRIEDPSRSVKDVLDSAEYPLFGTLSLVETARRVVTSSGFDGEEARNYYMAYFRSMNKERSGQWSTVSSTMNDSDLPFTVKKSVEYASIDGEAELEEGRYDVVLSPLVLANLMEIVAQMSSAYNLVSAMSFLVKRKVGDTVASPKLTLRDTPKNELVGNINFDDEGTLTFNKPIIEGGTLKTFLFNNSLGRKYNTRSTGNAGWVEPRPWALEIAEGDVSENALTDGNVVFFNNNWYTRLQNYYEGQFSTVGRDAIIVFKDGKPVGRVRRARIADTLPSIINNIDELSKSSYKQMWWEVEVPTKSPFALIRNVKLTKG